MRRSFLRPGFPRLWRYTVIRDQNRDKENTLTYFLQSIPIFRSEQYTIVLEHPLVYLWKRK
jgi:hypothetical protein